MRNSKWRDVDEVEVYCTEVRVLAVCKPFDSKNVFDKRFVEKDILSAWIHIYD